METGTLLFNFLRDLIYSPSQATLDVKSLPKDFQDLGEGLVCLARWVSEAREFAQDLAKGNLDVQPPLPGNELAAPLKSLHAALQHLTWQTQQISKGDYRQRVEFMGNFDLAFNSMVQQLEERRRLDADEKFKLQQYVNLFLDNCQDIILLFDIDGRVVFTSKSFIYHNNIQDTCVIKNKFFHELFSPFVSNEFLHKMNDFFYKSTVEKLSSYVQQEIAFGKNEIPRHYGIQVTPMLDENAVVVGTMLFFHDMTENINAQHAAEYARELAEQATQAKSEFLARMSHEMRTPMSAIIGMTAIAKKSNDSDRMLYCLDKIDNASRHLLGVINDILDMAKIEADKFELSPVVFNFTSLVDRVVSIIAFRIEEKKQTLLVDIDEKIPSSILGDEQQLSQVLINLLSNAVKFTPEQGEVSLAARLMAIHDGACVIRFIVKDTGIGISEEQQKRLFISFNQADGSFSRKFGGTGLGLTISKRIVNLMGGDIWIESELGQGASFIFDIHVRMGQSLAQALTGETPQQGLVPRGKPFTGRRVLVAEDIDINREIIAAFLEELGVETVFAVDGMEAVEKFLAAPHEYDMILMDIHMPGMDGYEATGRIRSSGLPGAETIPIIAMTANVFREHIDHCLASGMDGHLGKPIDVDALATELKKYL